MHKMHIQKTDKNIIVSTESAEGHREFSLRCEEAGRLIAGESILREGMIMRRLGNLVELRTASPGIAFERRTLGTISIESFFEA